MDRKFSSCFCCLNSTLTLLALILTILTVSGMAKAHVAAPNAETSSSDDNLVFEGMKAQFEYPPTPWLLDMSFQYFWVGVPYPSITAADDWIPDPNIQYLGATIVGLHRFTSTFLGPSWDVFVTSSFVRVKNGAPVSRITREYSSIDVSEGYPLHMPGKLARFEWKQQASGGMDVQIFFPPNATTPLAEFTGISTLPLSVPIANTTALGPLVQDFLSTVQTVPRTGEIPSSYARNFCSYSTEATLTTFSNLSSPNGELDPFFRGIIPIGVAFTGGAFGVRVDPYTPSN